MYHCKRFFFVFAFMSFGFALSWWVQPNHVQRGLASAEAHYQSHVHYDPAYKL